MKIVYFFLFANICLFSNTNAYETDQYSTAFYHLEDSTVLLNKVVNDVIEHVVINWNKPRDDFKLLSRVSGFLHSRQFEKWANDNKLIDSRNVKSDSIFKTTSWESSPIIRWRGLSSTFSLNHIQIGADKLSHFFGVGWIYWKESEVENEGETEGARRAAAIEKGLFTEENYWGRLSTNVFSNADLVANWEGYLFFRGMFEDDIVNGKESIILWQGDRPTIQRKFDFADHVNDFWNESLLPNDYDSMLAVKVKNVLRSYCDRSQYKAHPEKWLSKIFDTLWKKYRFLQLDEDAIEFRMDMICGEYNSWSAINKAVFRKKELKEQLTYKTAMAEQPLTEKELQPVIDKIIDRIKSPLSSCNKSIGLTINEHILLTNKLALLDDGLKNLLTAAVKTTGQEKVNKFKLANAQSISKKYFKAVFKKIKPRKIKINEWDNIYRSRLTQNLKFKNKKIKIIAEFTNYGNELIKECMILPIVSKESSLPIRAGYANMSIYHCSYSDIKNKTNVTKTFWRAYDKDKKLRSSLKDYWDVDDREAYVYRMLPKICTWY